MSKKNSKQLELLDEQKKKAELLQMKKNDPAIIKEQIFLLKEQFQDIVQKKKQMQSEIQQMEISNNKQTLEYQKQLRSQQQMCADCQSQLAEFVKKSDIQIRALKIAKDNELDEFIAKKQQQKEQIFKQRQQLQQKLEYLKQYPERQKKYAKAVQQLNQKMNKMLKDQQKDIKNIKNQYQFKRNLNQQGTKEQIQRIKTFQKTKLEKRMTRDQYIKRENQVMEKEIDLCQQQKSALQSECKEISMQIQTDKQKNNYQNALGTQAGETYQRSLRIIKLQGKLSKLKAYLTQQTTRMEKQYEDLDAMFAKQYHQLQNKISKAQGWLRLKQRDLKKVKACSQMVLNQRSNLECYLLEVFYEHPELDYKNTAQISQVLRYLFAKINSKKPPITYKNYLTQSNNSMSSSISKI